MDQMPTFVEKVAAQLGNQQLELINTIPEISGVASVLVYDQSLSGTGLPFCVLHGRDVVDPVFQLRLIEQLWKTLHDQVLKFRSTIVMANSVLKELDEQLGARRAELQGSSGKQS